MSKEQNVTEERDGIEEVQKDKKFSFILGIVIGIAIMIFLVIISIVVR